MLHSLFHLVLDKEVPQAVYLESGLAAISLGAHCTLRNLGQCPRPTLVVMLVMIQKSALEESNLMPRTPSISLKILKIVTTRTDTIDTLDSAIKE